MRSSHLICSAGLLSWAAFAGCMSPYRADQGALFGGLTGAGVGAIVGEALDQPLAGAAIGGAVGTLTGAVVGGQLDEIEARNRAEIAARLGRPAPTGAATVQDVVAMTQAGVTEDVIITHVQNHGVAQVLSPGDLIYLQNQGVAARVIQAMQNPPSRPAVAQATTVIHEPPPPPVIIQEHYIADPWYPPPFYHGPPHWHWRHRRPPRCYDPGPRVGFGLSISSDHF